MSRSREYRRKRRGEDPGCCGRFPLSTRAVWFQRAASSLFGFDRYNRRWHVDAEPNAVEGAAVEFPKDAVTEAFFHDMRGCGN